MSTFRDVGAVLASEKYYFDREAESLNDSQLAIEPAQMRRYREARIRPGNIPKDTLFAMMPPLAGKRVLEYGCGIGEDSCHLADCGAMVKAFDLSPVSISRARRRAQIMELADRIVFDVKTAGELDYTPGSFDLIVGSAVLHHLHMNLDAIYAELDRLLISDGSLYFIEPVANSRMLRNLRTVTPVCCDATPDERQLYYSDFELLKKYGFPRVEYVHFYCLERLHRVLGGHGTKTLRWIDHFAQRALPMLRRYYGIVLVMAHRQ